MISTLASRWGILGAIPGRGTKMFVSNKHRCAPTLGTLLTRGSEAMGIVVRETLTGCNFRDIVRETSWNRKAKCYATKHCSLPSSNDLCSILPSTILLLCTKPVLVLVARTPYGSLQVYWTASRGCPSAAASNSYLPTHLATIW